MNKAFSVSMCVYGKDDPAWFRDAVDSVLGQTVKAQEIVLVVDGPVPEALDREIVRCEQTAEFRVIRLPENVGHGEARRTGLSHCRFPLVALMDADDLCEPDRFEKQLAVFEKDPTLSIVGGNIAEFIDDPQTVVGRRVVPQEHTAICEYLKTRCPFNQMTVMFRRDDVEEAGGYLDWYCDEDYYLWVRMFLKNKRFANLPDILVRVRVGADMYKRRGGWKYFKSEAKLQRFMRKQRVIGFPTYAVNVTKRFLLQVMMPNAVRGWVFRKFARTNGENEL